MHEVRDTQLHTILKGCAEQDRKSQNALYRLYYAYGMSICIRYAYSESEAISILNEGFLKVYRGIDSFDFNKPFKPWFRQIIVNTAINAIKKQKQFKMEVNIEEAQHVSKTDDVFSAIGYKELMKVVQSLSSSYRAVFNMYVIDGYKHEEISKLLGISVSTSKSNLARARANLRELITKKMNKPYV